MTWNDSYGTERGRWVDIDWLTWQKLNLDTTALETWQPESGTSKDGRLKIKNTKQYP